jgi:integrase
LKRYRRTGKGAKTAEPSIDAHIRPALGKVELARLTSVKIEEWHHQLAESPARVRRRKTATEQAYRPAPQTEDEKRARRSTANHILTILKAALNHAWKAGKVSNDQAWRKVSPFRGVDAPVIRYLTEAECLRLVNACASDIRTLVRAALFTGCRYNELATMAASDFNPDTGTVTVRVSKSGKRRHVILTAEGQKFFAAVTAGQPSDALIFTRLIRDALPNRRQGNSRSKEASKTPTFGPWGKNHQQRPLAVACKAAKIKPAISFHILRHTHASILAMRGVPIPVIAQQLGHADTRITEKHYAHLAPNYVADTIRASFPTLGITETTNVTSINRTTQTN